MLKSPLNHLNRDHFLDSNTGLLGPSCRSSGADAASCGSRSVEHLFLTLLPSGPLPLTLRWERLSGHEIPGGSLTPCWVTAPPHHSFELHCAEDWWPRTWGDRSPLPGSSQTRQWLKMATLAQLHAMCSTLCSLLCSCTSWLLFAEMAQTHADQLFTHAVATWWI